MTVTALQLAGEIVRRQSTRGRYVTNLSLQKLAYFCQGWHLALADRPLVADSFEAWKFGPVLPSVYHKFKVFSSNPIPPEHPLVRSSEAQLDNWSSALIDRVLDVYGEYTGAQLVEMSHVTDGPWARVWDADGGIMDNADIQTYFKSLSKSTAAAAA